MWLIKVNEKEFPKDATGNILGIDFTLGYAIVDSQYYYRFFIEKGFQDVTPKWMRDIKVDLSKPDSEVLVVRWGGFGDNLLVEPAIRSLKEKYPNIKIHFAGRAEQRRLLFMNPAIDFYFKGMKHQLSQYIGQYDEVWDFTHSIECNPESEYKDAKEIACDWVGLKPKEMTPKIFLTKSEVEEARRILKNNKVDVSKDTIIGLHVESSSFIRSFHPDFTIKLANKLAKQNYKVILLGNSYRDIQKLHFTKCPKCKKEHRIIQSNRVFKIKCKGCGKIFKYCINPNIVNLIGKTEDIRVASGIVKMCDLLIAPDSGFVHIAQATGTKTLAIYCSFHASTRCKHYKNIYVYQRPFRCASCFQHGSKCLRWGGKSSFPPCTEIKVSEIYPLVKKLLKNKLEDYIPEGITPKFQQKCPICFSKKHDLICRKGNYFYFKCLNCGSIYLDRDVNIKYNDKNYYSQIYMTKNYKEGQRKIARVVIKQMSTRLSEDGAPRVLEIGCGIGTFLKEFKKKGWRELGIELNRWANTKARKLGIKTSIVDFESKDCNIKPSQYDLIVALHTIEHFKDIEKAFIKMRNGLYEKGKIFIACPDAEGYQNNTYAHLNTYYCGEHILLPSKKGLEILCGRLGLQVDNIHSSGQNILAWISKK